MGSVGTAGVATVGAGAGALSWVGSGGLKSEIGPPDASVDGSGVVAVAAGFVPVGFAGASGAACDTGAAEAGAWTTGDWGAI